MTTRPPPCRTRTPVHVSHLLSCGRGTGLLGGAARLSARQLQRHGNLACARCRACLSRSAESESQNATRAFPHAPNSHLGRGASGGEGGTWAAAAARQSQGERLTASVSRARKSASTSAPLKGRFAEAHMRRSSPGRRPKPSATSLNERQSCSKSPAARLTNGSAAPSNCAFPTRWPIAGVRQLACSEPKRSRKRSLRAAVRRHERGGRRRGCPTVALEWFPSPRQLCPPEPQSGQGGLGRCPRQQLAVARDCRGVDVPRVNACVRACEGAACARAARAVAGPDAGRRRRAGPRDLASQAGLLTQRLRRRPSTYRAARRRSRR